MAQLHLTELSDLNVTSVVINRKTRDLGSSPLAPTAGRWMDVANGEDDSGCHQLSSWLLLQFLELKS